MTVLMCSGQGAQKPGMGSDLLDIPEIAQAYALASETFGTDLCELVAGDDESWLDSTVLTQAITAALSIGIGRALMARGLEPAAIVGFSLGEISALPLAGVLNMEETFSLLRVRSEALAACVKAHPGAMLALLGCDASEARDLCDECARGEVLVLANFNCPGQIVLSGAIGAIDRAEQAWTTCGKRCSRLATAGAFHSPLMREAADELHTYCLGIEFSSPRIPLICNVDAQTFIAEEAPMRLSRHLVSPVLFEQSVRNLLADGQTVFIEAGYGGVLTKLVKRIDRDTKRIKIGTRAELETYLA